MEKDSYESDGEEEIKGEEFEEEIVDDKPDKDKENDIEYDKDGFIKSKDDKSSNDKKHRGYKYYLIKVIFILLNILIPPLGAILVFKSNKFSKIGKWIGTAWAVIFIAIIIFSPEENGNLENGKVAEEEVVEEEMTDQQLTERIIEGEKEGGEPVSYEIISEDVSIAKATGGKVPSELSEEGINIGELPDRKRANYDIVLGKEFEVNQIAPTAEKIIEDISQQEPEIDELAFFLYTTEDRVEGFYDIARVQWSPRGEFDGVDPEIARDNIKDKHEIFIELATDDIEEYLDRISEEEIRFGLKEEERREIWKELVLAEDRAQIEASMHYDEACEDCDGFIEHDLGKLTEMEMELISEYEEKIKDEYDITEEQVNEISTEAAMKNWPMPEPLPFPDCCDYE